MCGCVQSPPHLVWPGDGRCHALHSRGPCSQHFVLTVSLDSGLDSGLPVPVCSPALCGEDRVMWQVRMMVLVPTPPTPDWHSRSPNDLLMTKVP